MSNSDPEWFKAWFNQDYLELYSKRDATEAESQVAFLLNLKELSQLKDPTLLDVACGTGRHLSVLLKSIENSFGLDLSTSLLTSAPGALSGRLVTGDMRQLPVAANSLDLVTSFFTSFGYFQSLKDELKVLAEFHRILRPKGYVFFDLANKQHVADSLVLEESLVYSQGNAEITRRLYVNQGQTRVEKCIKLKKNDGQFAFHQEDVHLFDEKELSEILKLAGFNPVKTFGSFKGEPYSPNSERLILLAQKG